MVSYLDFECDLSDSFDNQAEGICASNMLKLNSFKNSESENPPQLLSSLNSKYRTSRIEPKKTLEHPSQTSKELHSEEENVYFGNKGLQISSALQENVIVPGSKNILQFSDSQLLNLKSKTPNDFKKSKETRYLIKEDIFGNVKAEKLSDDSTRSDIETKKERLKLKKEYLTSFFNKVNKSNKQLLITRNPTNQKKISLSRAEAQSRVQIHKTSKIPPSSEKKDKLAENCEEKGHESWEKLLVLSELSSSFKPNSSKVGALKTSFKDSPSTESLKKVSLNSPGPKKVTISKAADEVRIVPTENKDFRRVKAQLKRDQNHLNFMLIRILPNHLLGMDSA